MAPPPFLLPSRQTSDTWKIDGKVAKRDDVLKTVEGMHIRVSNLCQFLPQDKVPEFSKMTPEQLLEATEQAVDDSKLHDTHQSLMVLGDNERSAQVFGKKRKKREKKRK